MNRNEIKRMIELIDDQSIAQAADSDNSASTVRRPAWQRISFAAAAFCLVVISIYLLQSILLDQHQPTESANTTQPASTVNETIVTPKWENMAHFEKYLAGAIIDGMEFQAGVSKLDSTLIGNKMGQLEMSGYDAYKDTRHTIDAEWFSVRNIDPECLIAIRYEGYEGYYSFYNSWYEFATLADLIDKLNLEKNLVINNSIYNYYFTNNDPENGQFRIDVYKFPDELIYQEKIWDMLFEITDLENFTEVSNEQLGWEKVGISIDYPPSGQKNIGISLFENGYMTTNILGTMKTFNIGQEKVNQFVDYIKAEGTIYQTFGHDVTEETVEESNGGDEPAEIVVESTMSSGALPAHSSNIHLL